MQIPYYHINAFTDKTFAGNPAAVCLLPKMLSDELLQAIAKENNLPVTAFLVREQEKFAIRWLTPDYELDICGHGTLSAAYVIFTYLEPTWEKVDLHSRHETLPVFRQDDLITLNFPAQNTQPCTLALLADGLGRNPLETYEYKNERCFAVFDKEEEVRELKLNLDILKQLPHRGITVTAKGKYCDFVSRTFYPHKLNYEDPVTGASHCLLVPYWAKRLNKFTLHALQVSNRGGELFCQLENERVLMSGKAVLYSQGLIVIKV